MKIVNLTSNNIIGYPACGTVATVTTELTQIGYIDSIPLYNMNTTIKGLPAPKKLTWYIVTQDVLQATGRDDLLVPTVDANGVIGFITSRELQW